MATITTPQAAGHDVTARVKTAAAAMLAAGADVAQARARLQAVRLEGGWQARYDQADAERAVAAAEGAYERARAEHAAAREAEREHRRREFLPRKRALVGQLDAALRAAAAVNAQLVDLEAREREAVGNHTAEWWSWAELMPGTSLAESRLDVWRRAARANGLLDEK
jgi:hypothetical protein